MRVVLYYPPVTPRTAFPTWEPLQLMHLGRMLRGSDVETVIIDGRAGDAAATRRRIAEALKGDKTICFGVTSLTCYQFPEGLAAAEYVRELDPGIPVLFGGWHATTFFEETLREGAVDMVVRGQGEGAFRELVERLARSEGPEGVKGVSWKKDGVITHEDDRPLIPPDDLPPLLPEDFDRLEPGLYQTGSVLFHMTSVGCPYSCAYCSISAACKRKWIPLSAAKVTGELNALHRRFGFREVVFWDNVFFVNRQRVRDICEHLIREGTPFSWSAHARINEVITWDDDFLGTLKRSGCKAAFIGAESGSQAVLDRIDKKINARDIIPAFRKLRDHGIDVAVNWMVGFPGERYEDMVRTVRCIRDGLALYDFDTDRFRVFMYRFVPFPGTPIFSRLSPEETAGLPKTARAWADYIYSKVNDGMDPWMLENGPSLFASSSFYLWKAYLQQTTAAGLTTRILRSAARLRIAAGFLRIPVEWWLWKRKHGIR